MNQSGSIQTGSVQSGSVQSGYTQTEQIQSEDLFASLPTPFTPDEEKALLRRYEPILRYTHGEQFFPLSAERYITGCSLWVQRARQTPVRLIPWQDLTLNALAQPRDDAFDSVYYLRLEEEAADALGAKSSRAMARQTALEKLWSEATFRAGRGRLVRVGYTSRFIDAIFSLSLLARGRVTKERSELALRLYRQLMQEREHFCYHGRVVYQNGWIVLQYWFLYTYNNWRSSFFGANDHEADWEMISIYLARVDGDGNGDGNKSGNGDLDSPVADRAQVHNLSHPPSINDLKPFWVAYASHDHDGDDLRRRWDDPEVECIDNHPVVYAGAGSHASFFSPGEYLTELELRFLAPVAQLLEQGQRVWYQQLRQYRPPEPGEQVEEPSSNFFRIPFVDYARGDGISIGPGQAREWSDPVLLSRPPGWVSKYRGLWGMLTRDPFSGEDAPAGPMYNRNGTVRRSWVDPVGWAGLDKVPPPAVEQILLRQRRQELTARRQALTEQIEEMGRALMLLGIDAQAMRGEPHLATTFEQNQQQIAELSKEVSNLRAELTHDAALLESLSGYETALRAGNRGPTRQHIRRAHRPTTRQELRLGRVAEFWAAISIGVMLLFFVWLITTRQNFVVQGLLLMLTLFLFVEASFRGKLIQLVTRITVALTLLSALVLIYEFFWQLVIAGVLATGIYILWENIQELWR